MTAPREFPATAATAAGARLVVIAAARRLPGAALLFAALLAVTSCARPLPRPAAPGLTDAEITHVARLLQLEDFRVYEPDVFDALLAHPGEEVRRRAALAAGRIGDPAATAALLRTLGADPSPGVRADAAFALGLLGDTSAAVLAGLEAAAPGSWVPASNEEVPVVVEVLSALGRLGTERARALVHAALHAAAAGDSERHLATAGEALLAVWKFDGGPGNVRAALPYLESAHAGLRWRAAYALMRGGDPSALRPLLEHQDDNARVLAYTARSLNAGTADSLGVADAALSRLEALLRDPNPHVRINAVQSLAGYGERAPVQAMAALLHDDDAAVGFAAAGAVGSLGHRALPPLAAAVEDATLPLPLRAAILEALAPLAPETAAGTALDWSRRDTQHRYLAARTLVGIPERAAPGLAARLAADPDRRVALAALGAVVQRGGSAADTARLVAAAERLGAADERTAAEGEASRARLAGDEGLAFYESVVQRYVAPIAAGAARPRVRIETPHGPITLELLADDAPLTVHNFMTLVRDGFFDDGVWHRVIPNFVLQDGAPGGYPDGGPGWAIRDEINRHRYHRGTLGMALSGPDTGGSQWFITHSPQPHLDGSYTVFGRVVDGMAAADAVLQGELIPAIRVVQ